MRNSLICCVIKTGASFLNAPVVSGKKWFIFNFPDSCYRSPIRGGMRSNS